MIIVTLDYLEHSKDQIATLGCPVDLARTMLACTVQ